MAGASRGIRIDIGGSANLGFLGQARSALRSFLAETGNVGSSRARTIQGPRTNMSGLQMAASSGGRILTSTGKMYQNVVTGYEATNRRLVAASRAATMSGQGASGGFGMGFPTFGTRMSPTGRAMVSRDDITPILKRVQTGTFRSVYGDPAQIATATQAMSGFDRGMDRIMRDRVLADTTYKATMADLTARKKQLSQEGGLSLIHI